MDRQVVRDLVEIKTPRVLKDLAPYGGEWQVHYAFFSRRGITEAAQEEAERYQALVVDLARLDADLRSN